MAYLFKNTPLQTNFNVNLTCLLPAVGAEVAVPARLDLKTMLVHFLDFRLEVVTRRFRTSWRTCSGGSTSSKGSRSSSTTSTRRSGSSGPATASPTPRPS